MKVVSLVDNKALPQRKDLRAEPGLAMCIDTGGRRILFDTGVTGAFHTNAQKLQVDVAGVSLAVLSHHHFDHGGGLAAFFAANAGAKVYLRSGGSGHLYLHLPGLLRRRIGLDQSLLEGYQRRLAFIDQFNEIAPGVFVLTKIGQRHPAPKGNRHLFIHEGRSRRPDDFEHELILAVKEGAGLAVFTGCSHHGILNMLDAVREQFPGQAITAVFGGFHLIDLPPVNNMAGSREDIEALGRALGEYPVERFFTGHCTGAKAYRILKEVLGARLEYFAAGCETEV